MSSSDCRRFARSEQVVRHIGLDVAVDASGRRTAKGYLPHCACESGIRDLEDEPPSDLASDSFADPNPPCRKHRTSRPHDDATFVATPIGSAFATAPEVAWIGSQNE